jgi:hypothetical protein
MPQAESADVRLDVRARPQGAQRMFLIIVALASGAAGFWLTQAIDAAIRPGLPLALGIGLGIAAGVLFFAMEGARVLVFGDGKLVYTLHGRPNLRFALALITATRPVGDGMVGGIGIELSDPKQVEFLHKTGISPERMRRWREQFGVDLVLEGFPADVGERIDALRKA